MTNGSNIDIFVKKVQKLNIKNWQKCGKEMFNIQLRRDSRRAFPWRRRTAQRWRALRTRRWWSLAPGLELVMMMAVRMFWIRRRRRKGRWWSRFHRFHKMQTTSSLLGTDHLVVARDVHVPGQEHIKKASNLFTGCSKKVPDRITREKSIKPQTWNLSFKGPWKEPQM